MTRDERGVTMVELLVAMSITVVVGVVLSGAVVTGLSTTEQTRASLSQTQDRRLTTSHLDADVQSATSIATSSSCGSGAVLVSLRWDQDGVAREAAYRLRTVGGDRRVTRALCSDGGAATLKDVAYEVSPTIDPEVTCSPSPCASARRVTLEVTDPTGSAYEATGVRRST